MQSSGVSWRASDEATLRRGLNLIGWGTLLTFFDLWVGGFNLAHHAIGLLFLAFGAVWAQSALQGSLRWSCWLLGIASALAFVDWMATGWVSHAERRFYFEFGFLVGGRYGLGLLYVPMFWAGLLLLFHRLGRWSGEQHLRRSPRLWRTSFYTFAGTFGLWATAIVSLFITRMHLSFEPGWGLLAGIATVHFAPVAVLGITIWRTKRELSEQSNPEAAFPSVL